MSYEFERQLIAQLETAKNYVSQAIDLLEKKNTSIKVMEQITTSQVILKQITLEIVSQSSDECMKNILHSQDPGQRMQNLRELLKLYLFPDIYSSENYSHLWRDDEFENR